MRKSGARIAKYFNPLLVALRALGGQGRRAEVCDRIAADLHVPSAERERQNPSGGSRFENDIAWARRYLVVTGYLESPARGIWGLTQLGWEAGELSDEEIAELIRLFGTKGS